MHYAASITSPEAAEDRASAEQLQAGVQCLRATDTMGPCRSHAP